MRDHVVSYGVLQAEARASVQPSALETPIPADVAMLLSGWAAGRGQKAARIYRYTPPGKSVGQIFLDVEQGYGDLGPVDTMTFRFGGWDERGELVMESICWSSSDQMFGEAEFAEAIAAFDARAKEAERMAKGLDKDVDDLFRRAVIHLVYDEEN